MQPRTHPVRLLAAWFLLCGAMVSRTAVAVPSPPQPASVSNRYNAELAALQAGFAGASAPEQSALLRRMFKLRAYVDHPQAVADILAQVAANTSLHPLVRDEAQWWLVAIDIKTGHLEVAENRLTSLGFLRRWMILGPFTSTSGLSAAPPAKDADWHRLPAPGSYAWADVSDFRTASPTSVAYLASAVHVTAITSVALRFAADSPQALFLNGRQVFADSSDTTAEFDQHAVGVLLQPGWNTILVKLARNSGGAWRFALRITAVEGGGRRVRASAEEANTAIAAYAASAPNREQLAVDDLVAIARAEADKDPRSPGILASLGEVERDHGRAGAFDHLEAAAKLGPTAERWLAVARGCDDVHCSYAALNAALSAEPGDARVTAALADYYYGRGQLEKARDLLQAVVRREPGDFVARKRLADLFSSAGATSEALRMYRQLEREFPGPRWLARELALRYEDLGLYDDALRLAKAALAADLDDSRQRACLQRIYARRHDTAGLALLAAESAQLRPADARAISEAARLAAASGDFQRSVEALNYALESRAGDAEMHRQLARVLQLRRRSDIVPQADDAGNVGLGDESLSFEFAKQPKPSGDAKYIVDADQVARQAFSRPEPETAANAIALADVTVERMLHNGLSSVRNQQLYYIANQQGARDFATRTVQYGSGTQRLEILAARVHKPDGRILEAEDAGENSLADRSISMYYDSRVRLLRFPGLEKGDVLELDYRLSPAGGTNPYGDYFGDLVTFWSSLPAKLRRYVLIAPVARKLNIYQERMPSAAAVSEAGGQKIYRWEAADMPALPSEPRGPAITDVAPYVSVSTFQSWQELGRWYAGLIVPQFTLDSRLRGVVGELTAGKTLDADKIRAIHEFVLRNTHYVALEFGVYSYKPYPVSQVYARRFGDCKDKASLMIALLRAAGIEAQIALVRTRKMGDVGDGATTVSVFNHAVAYIPKYDMWLDGTAEYSGSRELPLDDQGAMAFTVGLDGSAQMRRIPVSLPLENYTHRTVRAQLQADGAIEFSGSAYTRGEDAPGLRREYEVRERQADSVRNNLARVYPSVRVQSVTVEGAHDLEKDVQVRFWGTLDSFAGRTLLSLAPSWMPHTYVQDLAPLTSRSLDLLFPAPWTREEELHFYLPDGAGFVSVPQNVSLDTPYGSLVIRYQLHGRDLTILTSVQFRKLRITPKEYVAFREFCASIERAFRNEVKVRLAASEG